jgi:hypothetical protein
MVIQVCFRANHPKCRRARKASGGLILTPVCIIADRSGGIIAHDDLVLACKQPPGAKQSIFHGLTQQVASV